MYEDVLECLLAFWKKKAILSKWETEQLKSFAGQRGSTGEDFIPWVSCYLAQRMGALSLRGQWHSQPYL